LSIWSDQLEAAGISYPLADIAWAGLVNDPAPPQGAHPLPAVAWRLVNGQYASATPSDPPHAWQVLEALYAQRPDLRTPLPPPGPSPAQTGGWGPLPSGAMPGYQGYGYAPGYPPPGYPPPGYPPPGYAPPKSHDNQTVMAGLAHLSIFFGALIVPLILWLVNRGQAPYAAQQSKQAFFFHLGLWVVELVVLVPGIIVYFTSFFSFFESTAYTTQPPMFPIGAFSIFIIMYVIVGAVQLVGIIFGVIGAVKAFRGEPFHYPLMSRV
jgi:uncharacterized protein